MDFTGKDLGLAGKSRKMLWITSAAVILGIIAALILVFGLYRRQQVRQQAAKDAAEVAERVVRQLEQQEELVETAQTVASPPALPNVNPEGNPVAGEIPEVNPVERANPFAEVYMNPFE